MFPGPGLHNKTLDGHSIDKISAGNGTKKLPLNSTSQYKKMIFIQQQNQLCFALAGN